MEDIGVATIKQFLIKARQSTWAGDGEKAEPTRSGATRYIFKEGDLRYEDEYFGGVRFQGQEVIFLKGEAMRGMVYFGSLDQLALRDLVLKADDVYGKLRDHLTSLVKSTRMGAKTVSCESDGAQYSAKSTGEFEEIGHFVGEEQIEYQQGALWRAVYRGWYAGGLIR